MTNYSLICSDGSHVTHLHKDVVNKDTLKKEHIMETYMEVYGIVEGNNINPIVGTYFCVGSGEYIVVSKDAIYNYKNKFDPTINNSYTSQTYIGMTLTRYDPGTLVYIIDVEQFKDDYITYIKVIKPFSY